MSRQVLSSITLAIGLSACSTTLSMTGPSFPSRGEHCEFQMLTASPANGFQEIGVIDVTPGQFGANTYRDIAEFKGHIEPLVCQAGGDAALAQANGFGYYLKATVLKLAPPSPAPAREAAPAPAAPGGCQFDTQCKGDRVCVKGECVAPASSK